MAFQTMDNLFAASKYIVDSNGGTPYSLIQAAINSAHTAGVPATVIVRPGTYTENLTLYTNISIQGDGATADLVTIIGIHTPPASGNFSISNCTMQSATHIFSSAAAGTAALVVKDCIFACTNGYAFNLASWSSRLTIANCTENSADNHGVNNAGTASVLISSSNFGNSTTAMSLSGDVEIYASNIAAPLSITGAGDVIIDNGSTLLEGITLAGTATLTIKNASFETGANAAITTTSTGLTVLANVVIDSSATYVITGTGSVQFGEVTYLNIADINPTITQLYGSHVQTGSLNISTLGNISFDGIPTVSTNAVNSIFIGPNSTPTALSGGINNTFLGSNVGLNATNASNNTWIGAAPYGTVLNHGASNVIVGTTSGQNLDGSCNTVVGNSALQNSALASYNTCIGYNSGSGCTGAADSSNILIGNVGADESNAIRIGTQGTSSFQQDKCFIAGIYGTTVTASPQMVVSDSNGQLGTRAIPSEVAFSVYMSANATSATGDSTLFVPPFDTAYFDAVVPNYNTTTYQFVAPVAGLYWFVANLYMYSLGTAHTLLTANIITTGVSYQFSKLNPAACAYGDTSTSNGALTINGSVFAHMAAGDTAQVDIAIDGGTKTVNLSGGLSFGCYFSGYLVS
jgi:hypothetical protein